MRTIALLLAVLVLAIACSGGEVVEETPPTPTDDGTAEVPDLVEEQEIADVDAGVDTAEDDLSELEDLEAEIDVLDADLEGLNEDLDLI